jgi:aspartyl-tRNA(Asn)/glutamyl-tRNA(Gln) amidotransferase subunit B
MYIPTIGLEIHAELKTKTKMFCSCKNAPNEERPNVNVCPICLGHPGTLPAINREAVKLMAKIGLALQGTIADYSQFDRKSYFYPDLPKGYQISQYEHPIVEKGFLRDTRITRIHLEEDAGRLSHADDRSLVDFNRAGLPLMELVTEPDIHNAEEAVSFARGLQEILRYLGASDADMEKGQMRIEANISIAPEGAGKLGTKVEVKNINSFKAVHDAIEFEIDRQSKLLDEGKKIVQETRGWDDMRNVTVSQRIKEEANDYRYFPEPDLPPMNLLSGPDKFDLKKIKSEIPELPDEKRNRFGVEYGLNKDIVETLVAEKELADWFEEAASELKEKTEKSDVQLLANYLTSDLKGLMKVESVSIDEIKIKPEHLAHLVFLIQNGKLTSRLAKDMLAKMFETGDDPESLAKSEDMETLSDEGELQKIIGEVIAKNEKSVADYKKGKQNALQFLVGQVMARTKGKAEPGLTKKILERILTDTERNT